MAHNGRAPMILYTELNRHYLNRIGMVILAGAWLFITSGMIAFAEDLGLSLELEPSTEGNWRVLYTLSEPVGSLVFARGNGDYRSASWSLDDEAFVLERLGSTDRIRRRDDGAFSHVAASLSPFSEKLAKDYTPFLRFSDGGMAVFTGQFIVGEPLVRSWRPAEVS